MYITTKKPRAIFKVSVLPLSVLLWSTVLPLVGAVEVGEDKKKIENVAAFDFLSPESEAHINAVIKQMSEIGGTGALDYLQAHTPVELTLKQIMDDALGRNLLIQTQQQDKEIASELLKESEAAFLPILDFSGSYLRTETFDRSELITRQRPITLTNSGDNLDALLNLDQKGQSNSTDEEGNPIEVSTAAGTLVCVTVDERFINEQQCSLQTRRTRALEFASVRGTPNKAWSFGFGASQLFPWGANIEASFQSSRRIKSFFNFDPSGLLQPLSLNDPLGAGSRFPWTTSFLAAFNTPLPFSKDFGPYGFFPNVSVMLAEQSNRRADWEVEAINNAVLRDVNGAYWELVRSIKQLQIVIEQRGVLEDLAKHANVLFEAHTITAYDQAQINADLETIRNQEQIAWNDFIANSNILVNLLDYEHNQVLLPIAYTQELMVPVKVDPDDAFTTTMAHRPEIKASQLNVESSEILLKHRRVQTLPDLVLSAGVFLNQSDLVLGYESWEDSFSNVFDPDNRDFFIGVGFRIPLGNRAVKAALAQARISRDQAWDQTQQTINSVTQELNTVIANTYGTQTQIEQTKINLDLAQLSYQKATGLIEQGMIANFELLRKLGDLLTARSAYIDALVNHKKTQAQLMAAEGVLAAQY